jgi:hypothetical protein
LRVDGAQVALTGRFRFEPPPAGAYEWRMTSPPRIAPGVRVRLLPGRMPGLLVENTGALPLLILGIDGEPFLRVGPEGVDANTRSETWRQSGRRFASSNAAGEMSTEADWQRVAQTPRFSWIEPRARASTWQVPMRLGHDRFEVSGVAAWVPFETAE